MKKARKRWGKLLQNVKVGNSGTHRYWIPNVLSWITNF